MQAATPSSPRCGRPLPRATEGKVIGPVR